MTIIQIPVKATATLWWPDVGPPSATAANINPWLGEDMPGCVVLRDVAVRCESGWPDLTDAGSWHPADTGRGSWKKTHLPGHFDVLMPTCPQSFIFRKIQRQRLSVYDGIGNADWGLRYSQGSVKVMHWPLPIPTLPYKAKESNCSLYRYTVTIFGFAEQNSWWLLNSQHISATTCHTFKPNSSDLSRNLWLLLLLKYQKKNLMHLLLFNYLTTTQPIDSVLFGR